MANLSKTDWQQPNGITHNPTPQADWGGKFHNWAACTWHCRIDIIFSCRTYGANTYTLSSVNSNYGHGRFAILRLHLALACRYIISVWRYMTTCLRALAAGYILIMIELLHVLNTSSETGSQDHIDNIATHSCVESPNYSAMTYSSKTGLALALWYHILGTRAKRLCAGKGHHLARTSGSVV